MKVTLGLLLSLILLLPACGFRKDKASGEAGAVGGDTSKPGFVQIQTRVFRPYCLSCHSGSQEPNLLTYEEVKKSLGKINDRAVVQGTMPKAQSLPDAERQLLKVWIESGAPEQPPVAGTPATPTQPGEVLDTGQGIDTSGVDPADLRWNRVSVQIFQASCLGCHSGNQAPDLRTYENVKANLAIIGNEIFSKQMPPRGPIALKEMALLKAWIDQGAPVGRADPKPTPGNGSGPRPKRFWSDVNNRVLKTSCTNCHFAGNPKGISDFSTIAPIRTSIGSILYVAVVAPVMPPAPPNTPETAPNPNQLTSDQKDLLSQWVVDGMLDDPTPAPGSPAKN